MAKHKQRTLFFALTLFIAAFSVYAQGITWEMWAALLLAVVIAIVPDRFFL